MGKSEGNFEIEGKKRQMFSLDMSKNAFFPYEVADEITCGEKLKIKSLLSYLYLLLFLII